jgi:hypothetical protein
MNLGKIMFGVALFSLGCGAGFIGRSRATAAPPASSGKPVSQFCQETSYETSDLDSVVRARGDQGWVVVSTTYIASQHIAVCFKSNQ